jgi:transcriptional regulator with XRE-family HTH domain
MENPILFGKLLREWRKSRQWTLEQLATELSKRGFEYDSSTLGKYERKERAPSGEFLAHLTCVGLSSEKALDWALAIGREFGIDTTLDYQRAKKNVRC